MAPQHSSAEQRPISVHEAKRSDAPTLLEIHERVLQEAEYFITLADEFTGTVQEKASLIRDLRRSENSVMLVARDGRRIAGYCVAYGGELERQRHVARFEIMVHPDLRNRGIGKVLLQALVEWARDNRLVTKLSLNVFSTNTRAIRLYKAMGFSEEGRRAKEYRDPDGTWRDEILMFLWLD